jgi:hypothetical protein
VNAVFIIWFLKNLATNSEKRMTRMMQRVGLDSVVTSLDDYPNKKAIKDARARCRRCPCEDLCERWLSGEVTGENTFCVNAPEFKRWMQITQNGAE